MEFNFSIPGLEASGLTVWDAGALVQLNSIDFHKLRNLLEDFGQRSAIAQGLRAPITDIWKLRSSDQRLYLQTAAAPSGCCVVLGGLKVGKKKLFMHRANGAIVEVEPLCVLDFYVHESHQRQGVGKALFEFMLDAEQLGAEQLAYDRPSSKLLAFLRKHYSLASYVPQPNNFVIFEQFYEHMPGSPGRGGKVSTSTSSSASWGPGALASLGHGRQTLHIIGSRAAAVRGVDPAAAEVWTRTSQRPPTASLQHSVQLHTAQAGSTGGSSSMSLGGSSLGGSSACSTNTSLGGAPAVVATSGAWSSLGGPGCPTAGTPTKKGEWDQPPLSPTGVQDTSQFYQQQQSMQQQMQPPVHYYARGTGLKGMVHGGNPADPYSHAGYQQALMAAAANPAPPRIKAGPLPQQAANNTHHNAWQQQQQQQQGLGSSGGGSCSSAQQQCGDSLDRLIGGISQRGSSRGGDAGSVGAYGSQTSNAIYGGGSNSNAFQAGGYGNTAYGSMSASTGTVGRQQYSPSPPYAAWEPRPGALLPQDASEGERVSLRRQGAQQAQQRIQQQRPLWEAAGAGPPGHLLAAPVSTYAVPTADMAEVIGQGAGVGRYHDQQQHQHQQHQRQPEEGQWGVQTGGSVGESSRNGRQQASSLCLSWDGLPTNLAASQQVGRGQGGVYGSAQWGSGSESRMAGLTARSGAGAASCMRMV